MKMNSYLKFHENGRHFVVVSYYSLGIFTLEEKDKSTSCKLHIDPFNNDVIRGKALKSVSFVLKGELYPKNELFLNKS